MRPLKRHILSNPKLRNNESQEKSQTQKPAANIQGWMQGIKRQPAESMQTSACANPLPQNSQLTWFTFSNVKPRVARANNRNSRARGRTASGENGSKKKYDAVRRERKSLTGAFSFTAFVVQPQQIAIDRDNKSPRNCCSSGSFFGNSYYFSSG